LSPEVPKAMVPNDHDAPSGADARYECLVPESLSQQIMAYSDDSTAKLQIVLLAGAALLLEKYTGLPKVRLGTAIDTQPAGEALINTVLTLQLAFETSTTFRDLLRQTRDELVNAVEHQNYPIEIISRDWPDSTGNLRDYNPLFDVACILEDLQDAAYLLPVKRNLTFHFRTEGSGLKASIVYDTARYTPGSVGLVWMNFGYFLAEALSDTGKALRSVAPPGGWLLESVAATGTELVHQLFEQNAERTPEAVAICDGGRSITYRRLNEAANQLAWRLKEKNAGPGGRVAVCLPNSIETVISLLGILKCGLAFVPIDKGLPPNRIRYMLNDAGVRVLISWADEPAADLFDGEVVLVDWPGLPACTKNTNPDLPLSGREAAYVIYTSGTSGVPKGVQIHQSGFARYCSWAAQEYTGNGQQSADFPFITSVAFDLTITSIFVPLIASGCIRIHDGPDVGALFSELLLDNQAGLLKITPSHLRLLSEVLQGMDAAARAALRLHTIIVGGEALSRNLAHLVHEQLGGKIKIVNEYGPTEAVVGCMVHNYSPADPAYGTVPVGKPIPGVRIKVLDGDLQPVPQGAIGEIFIESDSLATGYLNNPVLTQEKFLPGATGADSRMYKTGDLAKVLPDSNLLFIGRKDAQVKINGYRIELSEIENCARGAGICNAVAAVREIGDGTRQIVLYTTAQGQLEAAVKSRLAEFLPAYMVPACVMHLEAIPLTANGKTDYARLPHPAEEAPDGEAPDGEVEREMAALWKKYLGRERLGVNDNFYTSGGDSIKSLGLVSEINKTFRVKVQIKDLYRHKTIRNLAAHVEQLRRDQQEVAVPDTKQIDVLLQGLKNDILKTI